MAGAELVLLRRFSGAHQIAQGLVGGIRDPHRRQIAGAVTPGELLGISAVGLDPIARLDRHEGGGDHVARGAQGDQLPVESVARWPRFVTEAQRRGGPQLPDQSADRVGGMGNHTQRADLPVPFGDGHGDRGGMDIEPDKSYGSHGPTLLSHAALPRGVPTLKVIRALRNGARSFSFRHVDNPGRSLGFVHSD